MGKVRLKSFSKLKKAGIAGEIRTSAIANEMTKKPAVAPKSALHDVSKGRVTKGTKKSVTFRSNLTDVMAPMDVLQPTVTNSMGTTESAANPLKKILESALSKKKRKSIRKAERLKEKRKSFLKKIEVMKQKEREEKEAAKRKATPVIGDTMALLDALESIEQDLSKEATESVAAETQQQKRKQRFSVKRRQREIAEGLEYFATALQQRP